ncbi:MAG: hypothetical protein M3Q65_14040 [Chloroflexota bacterium]|nr:hypothetical protein [Chloroflexota bacterium]
MTTLTLLFHHGAYGGDGFGPGPFMLHPAMLWLGLILLFALRNKFGHSRRHGRTTTADRPARRSATEEGAGEGPLWPNLYPEPETPARPKQQEKDGLI